METTVDTESGLKRFSFQVKPVQRLHWEDTAADHLVTHEEPVILTGTNVVTPALRWTLPYLEENMGSTKHTVYLSKSRTFMYYDEKKVLLCS
ncbi:Hypoxia-inducible factor 1-alpha inhibitor [Geodia barretti]|uniref:Hypoxia-inducible factor 1-alpha inhibitor n=1 Tax=Geodia barretti TaxID=519541 RepID=A0AA35SA75_GEOBA|nr:Hypoxia-inducible factor 1-alpha inhibitor [Geodia barretti]